MLPGAMLRLEKGHEVEGDLDVAVLVRPFATPIRQVLSVFSVAAPPQSIRKRLTNAFVAIKHRGSWFCTDARGHVSSVSSMRRPTTSTWWTILSDGHVHSILTVQVKSRQRCVLGLGWHVRTPHHLRDTNVIPTENIKAEP
ncbi:MAG: hypothetical protein JKP98_18820 [Rhodobacteraceae bacterium]|jgi:hypothetical protein|nr:MAG: hypothetical protein N838_21525 [Thiohalocapsa sp. PB-PSB1]MBL4542708.1 hypothetical protein [Paracoccaceae bacterium]MBL4558370.1 hypothetical protein [Paracoccaceae bacterium]